MDKHKDLFGLIATGEENAVHLCELSRRCQISESSVKQAIKAARREGVPILSGRSGYWLPASEREKLRFAREIRKSGLSQLATASNVKRTVKPEGLTE